MPLLVTASVNLDHECRDRCANTEFGDCGDPECDDCDVMVSDGDGCVLLQGLSGATTLELTTESRVVCFNFWQFLLFCLFVVHFLFFNICIVICPHISLFSNKLIFYTFPSASSCLSLCFTDNIPSG